MTFRNRLSGSRAAAAIAAGVLAIAICGAEAHDASKYPDFSSQWIWIGGPQWDPSKPPGLKNRPR